MLIAVGLIEETAKLIVPALLLLLGRYRRPADGLLIGVASGAGFAVLETMGYGFVVLIISHGNLSAVDGVLMTRGLLSPAAHADLTGLPPMLLQAGTNEVLLDDSTRMAARATAAGVDVILDITADVPHVFQGFAGVLDEADQALDRAAHFLLQHVRTSD